MGCNQSFEVLTLLTKSKVNKIFDQLDSSHSGLIQRQIMLKFWTGPFASTYTKILFQEIDLNKDGVITKQEWSAYWRLLVKAGHSKKQLLQSLKSIQTGNLDFVFRFSNYRKNEKRDDLITEIMKETSGGNQTPSLIISAKSSRITTES